MKQLNSLAVWQLVVRVAMKLPGEGILKCDEAENRNLNGMVTAN